MSEKTITLTVDSSELQALTEKVQSAAGSVAFIGAAKAQEYAVGNIHAKFSSRQTGGLANSLRIDVKGDTAVLAPNTVYARIQEFGGTIHAVKAKALHFVIDGQDVFTKSVTLPARPYLGPAVDDHSDEVLEAMAGALEKVLK